MPALGHECASARQVDPLFHVAGDGLAEDGGPGVIEEFEAVGGAGVCAEAAEEAGCGGWERGGAAPVDEGGDDGDEREKVDEEGVEGDVVWRVHEEEGEEGEDDGAVDADSARKVAHPVAVTRALAVGEEGEDEPGSDARDEVGEDVGGGDAEGEGEAVEGRVEAVTDVHDAQVGQQVCEDDEGQGGAGVALEVELDAQVEGEGVVGHRGGDEVVVVEADGAGVGWAARGAGAEAGGSGAWGGRARCLEGRRRAGWRSGEEDARCPAAAAGCGLRGEGCAGCGEARAVGAEEGEGRRWGEGEREGGHGGIEGVDGGGGRVGAGVEGCFGGSGVSAGMERGQRRSGVNRLFLRGGSGMVAVKRLHVGCRCRGGQALEGGRLYAVQPVRDATRQPPVSVPEFRDRTAGYRR